MSIVRTSVSLPQNVYDYMLSSTNKRKTTVSAYISEIIKKEERKERMQALKHSYDLLSQDQDFNDETNQFIEAACKNYDLIEKNDK